MTYIELPSPDWDSLLGGSQEAAWIADRNRKFGLAAEMAGKVLATVKILRKRKLLFQCTPAVLRELTFAADWYVSLAGFSMKTLQNVKQGPASFGLKRHAKTLVERLRIGDNVPNAEVEAFSEWINSEIGNLFPPSEQNAELATVIVGMILGGRVIGRGQNLGGDDAVDMVKSLMVEAFAERGRAVEVELADGKWTIFRPEHNLPARQRFRFGGRIVAEFISGGDRPDVVILLDRVTIAVGEIKGRKDLSNVWESWMPGVYNHMRSWTGQNPDAVRLFFGTLISEAMIKGLSTHGTKHVGLQTLHRQGLLTAAYNISKVADNDPEAVKCFGGLVQTLDSLL